MGQFISPILNGVDESIHPRFLSDRWLHAIYCLLLFNWVPFLLKAPAGFLIRLSEPRLV